MPSLLTVPRELRDNILSNVVCAYRPAPTSISEISQQDRKRVRRKRHGAEATYHLINPSHYRPNASPLLLTCKQLHAETRDILKRNPLHYELDIKFLNERLFIPTWTFLPAASETVPSVRAVFQTVGTYEWPYPEPDKHARWTPPDIWRRYGGEPCPYVWDLYHLLVHFLNWGPVPPGTSRTKRRITIGRLEIDCVDPEDISLLPPKTVTDWERFQASLLHEQGVMDVHCPTEMLRPEWLADRLGGLLKWLLGVNYCTAEYGKALYRRIGAIAISVTGEVVHELDLGQMLARLCFNNSFGNLQRETRLAVWQKWREGSVRRRRERGFKVVDPPADWWEQAQAQANYLYSRRP